MLCDTPAEACGPDVRKVKSVVSARCQDVIHTTNATCAMQCCVWTNSSNFNLQPYNCSLTIPAAALGKYPGVLALTVKLCMLAPIGFLERNCDLDLGRCHRTPALPPALSVPGQEQPIRHNLRKHPSWQSISTI